MAFALLHLLEEAVGEEGEVEVEAVVVVVEEVVEVVVDKEVMATTSPKAQSRPGRGPVRPHRAMPT